MRIIVRIVHSKWFSSDPFHSYNSHELRCNIHSYNSASLFYKKKNWAKNGIRHFCWLLLWSTSIFFIVEVYTWFWWRISTRKSRIEEKSEIEIENSIPIKYRLKSWELSKFPHWKWWSFVVVYFLFYFFIHWYSYDNQCTLFQQSEYQHSIWFI